MRRSFDDRIFGGVCGGLQAATRLDAWWWRLGFVLLTLFSQGVGLLAYLLLWWLLPAASPTLRVRVGLNGLLAWGLALSVVIGYFLRAALVTETGVSCMSRCYCWPWPWSTWSKKPVPAKDGPFGA